jgi:MYXO-CTERM domain-containing protein
MSFCGNGRPRTSCVGHDDTGGPLIFAGRLPTFVLAYSLGLVAFTSAQPVFADDVKPSPTSVVMVPQLVHGFDYHTGAVVSIDGRFVASMHRGSIHVWDVESGALLPTLAAAGMPASTFLSDGIRLRFVSASLVDGKAAISTVTWDVTTGKTTQRNGPRGLLFPAMVPGGKRALLAESDTGAIRVYDIEGDKELRTFGGRPAVKVPPGKTNPNVVFSMVVPKDGAAVLLERGSGACELWDVERGRLRYEVKRKFPTGRTGISANGSRAVYTRLADDKGNIAFDVLDVAAGKLLRSITLGRGVVEAIAVSPDGRRAVTAESPGKIHLWDLDTGEEISQHVWPISSATTALSFISDNQILYGGSGRLEIWDIAQWERIRSFTDDKSQVSMLSGAAMVGAGERAAVVGYDGKTTQVWSWDLSRLGATGSKTLGPNTFLTFLALNASRVWAPVGLGISVWEIPSFAQRDMKQSRESALDSFFALTADGSRAIVGQTQSRVDPQTKKKVDEYVLSEWNAATGAQTDKIRVDKGNKTPRVIAASADGRFVSTADYNGATRQVDMRIWDVGKGSLARSLDTGSINYPSAAFSPDGRAIVVVHMATATPGRQMVQVFDVTTGDVKMSTKTNIFGLATSIAYSPNGQNIAVASGTIEVFQADSGTLLHTLRGDAQWVKALAFSSDGRHLLSAGQGGMAVLHRLDKPASVTMIGAGDDWLVYDADGYFDASRKGGRLVAAVDGSRAYRIDQLAVRNNRPDLLLEHMGLGTPEIITHYRTRYQRRLEKLGIRDEAGLPTFGTTPDVLLTAVDVDGARAKVRFDAMARGADLLRYNVFVNDVPLFGAVGKTTAGRVQHIEETIELGAGRNKIEVSALDARGGESLRAVRVVQHKPKVTGDLYYLGFGVSQYKNSKYDLGYPHKDVTDLGDVLRAGAGKTFGKVHVQTFVNEAATVSNIQASKEFLKNARVDDTVILFIAGHGLHANDAAADYYFATHEVDPRRLPETAARFDVVEDLLMGIQSRKKLFLMDTCESGERDAEDAPSGGIPTTSARTLVARSTRQLELDVAQATAVAGIPVPKRRIFDRERYIYNDLSRRTGAIVISSSRGSEFSFELEEIANGVFTEELLIGLTTDRADENHDAQVSTDELRKHLMKAVPQRTEDKQHPTVDRDNLDANFSFPVVPEAAAIVFRPDAVPPRLVEKPIAVSKPISTPASTPKPPGCACGVAETSATTTGILGMLFVAFALWMRRLC